MHDITTHTAPDPEFHFVADNHLARLHYWLSKSIPTSFLFLVSFFGPFSFLMNLVWYGAMLFTPYMLWKLFLIRRWGWIATFLLLVIGPAILARAVDGSVSRFILSYLPLALFYGYTWILKLATADWMEKQKGEAMLRYYDSKASSSQTSTAL